MMQQQRRPAQFRRVAYASESKKKRQARLSKARAEAKEAEELKAELGHAKKEQPGDLAMLIKKRQQSRSHQFDALIAGLEEKYGKPSKTKGGAAAEPGARRPKK